MNRLKLLGFTCLYAVKQIPTYVSLLNNYNQEKFDKLVNDYAKGALKALGITYEVINKLEEKPETALYIANHGSMFDPLITMETIGNNRSYFIANEFEGLLKVPVLGNLLRFMNSIYVDRQNPRSGIRTIKEGINKLNAGINLVIFAEGEITNMIIKPDQKYVGDFHGGSFKPAIKSQKPIIPITIIGSDQIHNGQKMYTKVKSGHVKIVIGEVIENHLLQTMTAIELAEYTRSIIVKNYEENWEK